jgi:phosphatidylserine/phosphatidylglycerophosphate/cardiolipin synthase-like enzyme
MVILLLACGRLIDRPDPVNAEDTGVEAVDTAWPDGDCKPTFVVRTLDAWGRSLDATVDFDREIPQPAALPDQALSFAAVAWAPDHLDHTATLRWDGAELSIETDGRALVSVESGECDAWSVWLAVEHAFFASSSAPWSRNKVRFLMDGEETWEAVESDVLYATERVSWATWWWESDFLMTRPWGYTSMEALQANDAETVLLINRFWGENSDWASYLNTDSELREAAEQTDDGFDVMLQGNPTDTPVQGTYEGEAAEWSFLERALSEQPGLNVVWHDGAGEQREDFTVQSASFHQKFIVVDGEVAFISGMNTKAADWDTSEHRVDEPLRDGTSPRKDYAMRLEGPAARDVEAVLQSRWEHARNNDALYSDKVSGFSLFDAASEGGVPSQVTVTLPEPWAEMSILESHARALAQAAEYIYIEDQYFRAPLLNEVIADRMLDEPSLVLIVVTQDVSEWDPGLKYSYLSEEWFEELFGDRFLLLTVGTFDIEIVEDWVYDDVYFTEGGISLHSKLRLIDDRFLSVGSCNFNNRGYLYEGEMNLSVLDEGVATDARQRVFENLVGPEYADWLTGDVATDMELLEELARYNREVADWWTTYDSAYDDAEEAQTDWDETHPVGFLLPLSFSEDYLEVGPDLF